MIEITRLSDIEALTQQYGVFPFFKNSIPQFSIEENTPDDLWFTDEPGPWDWKGPIIRRGKCAYGKIWNGKAAFVSMELLPDFINMRQTLGLTPFEQTILEVVEASESITTPELKRLFGNSDVRKKRQPFQPVKDFVLPDTKPKRRKAAQQSIDSALIHLQMAMKIVVADFEYRYTKQGERYGWGIARYTTPELLYETDFKALVSGRTPTQSQYLIYQRLKERLPHINAVELMKYVGNKTT